MTSPTEIKVGTAGWAVPARYADRIPPGGSQLARYARTLNAVEINTSFYRPHRPDTYRRWAGSVPAHFRFSVKLPKAITHERRLVASEELLDRFLADVAGLRETLGVLLIQLPPSLAFKQDAVAAFLAVLRQRHAGHVACEPRHPSWFDGKADPLLRAFEVARVAADPAPAPGAERPGGWDGFAYVRLHGSPRRYYSDYDAAALAGITTRLQELRARKIPAWCIFDNTAASHALGNALAVAAGLAA